MYSDSIFVVGWIIPTSYYKLSKAISAFEIAYSDGVERLGTICSLPGGADLETCGDGFNDRTLKVRCGEQCYYVFLQDLYSQQSPSRLNDTGPERRFAESCE